MEEKQYMIDGEPSSARDIISKAKELDEEYARGGFFQTSVSAGILRKHGYVVENNPDYIKS